MMRKTVSLVFTLLVANAVYAPSAYAQSLRLSEPVASDSKSETFGAIVDSALPEVSLTQVMENKSQFVNRPFQLHVRIARVCQKKGCFFIAQENDLVVRISFKDYSFFIPTDSTNKNVLIMGTLVEKQRSAEQAEHFNNDLQADDNMPALASGTVYEIVANGVKIPLS